MSVPSVIAEKGLSSQDNNNTIKNEKVLFERGYYKDISSKEIVPILDKWSKLILDMENSFIFKGNDQKKKEAMAKAHSEIFLYCSNETIEVLAIMQQLAYANTESSIDKHENMFLYSLLVSCIRHDYSGLFLDPLVLLKIKLGDYYANESKLKPFEKKYKEYYRKNIM